MSVISQSNGSIVCFLFCICVFRRQRECYYGDTFIASNKEVDKHIQKLYQGLKQSVCKFLLMVHVLLENPVEG